MKASEIMTREVVSVASDTPIRDIAKVMLDQHISGVPVIDHGKLVGIITENDLLRRAELGTERTRPRWLQFLTSDDTLLTEYIKSRGEAGRDVMTQKVMTVTPDTSIKAVAELMEIRQIKRVPVVDADRVVGIVSRANLVQALASYAPGPAPDVKTDDAFIHAAVCSEIAKIAWTPSPLTNNVIVSHGIVHLWGFVASEDERRAVLIAARRVAGVKEVRDRRRDLVPISGLT
jgi:CBS domain-containing protein